MDSQIISNKNEKKKHAIIFLLCAIVTVCIFTFCILANHNIDKQDKYDPFFYKNAFQDCLLFNKKSDIVAVQLVSSAWYRANNNLFRIVRYEINQSIKGFFAPGDIIIHSVLFDSPQTDVIYQTLRNGEELFFLIVPMDCIKKQDTEIISFINCDNETENFHRNIFYMEDNLYPVFLQQKWDSIENRIAIKEFLSIQKIISGEKQ